MKDNLKLFTGIIFLISLALSACEKKESELAGTQLINPFEPGNGIEIMKIDSVQKFYGANPYLKPYFHIDQNYVVDLGKVHRVIAYRDGFEIGRLSPGQFSYFIDINANVGGTYDYQLSLIMKDSSYTKRTQSYVITF